MNKTNLIGRLTQDPQVSYTGGDKPSCVARFTIAVNRRGAKEGTQQADFISCVAFGKVGELAEKYLVKGSQTAISGRIQTGSYTNKDGNKVYTTDIVVEELEFLSRASKATSEAPTEAPAEMPEEDELPFN